MNEEQRAKAVAFLSDPAKVDALVADINEDFKQPDYPREMLVDEVARLRGRLRRAEEDAAEADAFFRDERERRKALETALEEMTDRAEGCPLCRVVPVGCAVSRLSERTDGLSVELASNDPALIWDGAPRIGAAPEES